VGQVSTWAGNLRPVGHIFPFLTWLMAQETTDLVIRLGLVGKFIIYIHSSTLLLPFVFGRCRICQRFIFSDPVSLSLVIFLWWHGHLRMETISSCAATSTCMHRFFSLVHARFSTILERRGTGSLILPSMRRCRTKRGDGDCRSWLEKLRALYWPGSDRLAASVCLSWDRGCGLAS